MLGRLVAGGTLSAEEAECVMGQVLQGEATPAQIAGLLVALRGRGETIEEMTGFARAMVEHAEPLVIEGDLVDVVGTGGDRLRSINVSTIAAFVVAGAGARVCKHGNRAQSSSVGTADVLEALGVAVDLGPDGVARCVAEVGMGFCLAPRFHPAMRFAGPVRRELGVPTVFNFLGPLANPARVRRQLVGVSDPTMAAQDGRGTGGQRQPAVHGGLRRRRPRRAQRDLQVHRAGAGRRRPGVDRDAHLAPGPGRPWVRAEPPWRTCGGGDAAFNADVIRRVLEGERSPRRDIGVLNAAAALVLAGSAADLADGVALASDSIDSGRAAEVLAALARVSTAAKADEPAG